MGQELRDGAACVGVVVVVRARHEVWFWCGKQPFGLARQMILSCVLMWELFKMRSDGFHKESGQVSWVLIVKDMKAGVERGG